MTFLLVEGNSADAQEEPEQTKGDLWTSRGRTRQWRGLPSHKFCTLPERKGTDSLDFSQEATKRQHKEVFNIQSSTIDGGHPTPRDGNTRLPLMPLCCRCTLDVIQSHQSSGSILIPMTLPVLHNPSSSKSRSFLMDMASAIDFRFASDSRLGSRIPKLESGGTGSGDN